MSYYALISSLPSLTLNGSAVITLEYFLSSCEAYINGEKYRILEELSLDPQGNGFAENTLAGRYAAWECALRNAIVKRRSKVTDRDPESFLNKDIEEDHEAERIAAAAWNISNPLERERILDQARWMKIEDLENGEQFSFEQLCAYKLKLLIQRKWLGRSQDRAAQNLELSTESVVRSIESKSKQEN